MTTTRSAPVGPSLVLAVSLAAVAVAIWRWHESIVRAHRAAVTGESWDHVKSDYPLLPPTPPSPPSLSSELMDAIVQANPFSPQRRLAALPHEGASPGSSESVGAPATPQFLYKGRIMLGKRQRAIVEETTARKTYFLEVGQAVAGFKVLDIGENRVVLSDPQTNKEVVVSLTSAANESKGQVVPR